MPTAIACRLDDTHTARRPSLSDRFDQSVFNAVTSRSLVYNACWEDPAVDRLALNLGPDDTMLVITSAGCNVLDYALQAPRRIDAVDANPRQTALLELKLAGIRELQHGDFFDLFGRGQHADWPAIYHDALRTRLSPFARHFWDTHAEWFSPAGRGLYFHGLSGWVARAFHQYLRLRPALREAVEALFEAPDLEAQRALYDTRIAPLLWSRAVRWALSRQLTLSLLGVPHPQRQEVIAQHSGGVAAFVRDAIDYIARELPTRSNYFYALYVRGHYTPDCCPEYLTHAGFHVLKAGLIDRIHVHTATVTDFLQGHPLALSRFVLLDHMDWMSSYAPQALQDEWNEMLSRAVPGARFLFRSAHAAPAYLERVRAGPTRAPLRDALCFHDALARELTLRDRVHTYAGFHIADLPA